jgi:hypothetical protein
MARGVLPRLGGFRGSRSLRADCLRRGRRNGPSATITGAPCAWFYGGFLQQACSAIGPNPPEKIAGRARQLCPAIQTSKQNRVTGRHWIAS